MTEMPSGWSETTLSEVTSYVSRGKSPKYAERSGLPVVNQRAVRWSGIQDEHLKYIHDDQAPLWTPERFIQAGDVLWNSTGTGTIGRACLVRREHLSPPKVVDSHVTIVRPAPGVVDPRYLFAWIRGPEVQGLIESMSTGSTNQVELARGIVLSTRIPLPPLSEQRRIADKLDDLLARVDACRDRLDRVPGILKRFRQAVLAAATSGELTRDWRSEHDLDDDAWLERELGEVAAVGTGSTPLRSNPAFFAETGTPWVTSAATGRSVVTEASEFVTEAAIAAHRLKRYPIGTLLVAMYGEGKTRGQVSELGIEATINQACAAVCVDECKARRAYVRLALEANYLEMRQLAEGGAQPNLNLNKIKSFPIRLPSIDEQDAILKRTATLFALADVLQERLTAGRSTLEKLSPAILAKAFRGELVPQDPDDEPASVLLKRIRAARSGAAAQSGRGRRAPAPVGAP